MTFTESDAENDGKIKKEAGKTAMKVAQEHSPTIFAHFENVCESNEQEPWKVLGDMIVRGLNNEDFAERILNTDIDKSKISTGSYRKEDIEMVKNLADEFGLEPDEKEDPIEKIINNRIESKATSPLESFSQEDGDGNGAERKVRQLEQEIQELKQELKQERNGAEGTEPSGGKTETETKTETTSVESTTEEEKKDIDDLFGSDDGGEEEDEAEPEPEPEPESESESESEPEDETPFSEEMEEDDTVEVEGLSDDDEEEEEEELESAVEPVDDEE